MNLSVTALVAAGALALFGIAHAQSSLDPFDPGANNTVSALALQPDGKILVGGFFTTLGGGGDGTTTRNRIGRLNADGSLDRSFNPGADAEVSALALQRDGKIVVGGAFGALGGGGNGTTTRSRIGRLNADGSLDPSFNPGANNAKVLALAVQPDGKILVGGFFTTLGGGGTGTTSRNFLGRLNADGSLDTSFNPGANNVVLSLALQPDGKILVGGYFTTLGGGGSGTSPRHHIGRLNPDGSVDRSFDPGTNNAVSALAVQPDGKILVGGLFTSVGDGPDATPRNHIARINADGSLDTSFDPGANGIVYTLLVQRDGRIMLGGYFTRLGGGESGATSRNFIGRLNRDGSLDDGFDPGANGYVYGLTEQRDGQVLVHGGFTALGNGGTSVRNRLGRLVSNDESLEPIVQNLTKGTVPVLLRVWDVIVAGAAANTAFLIGAIVWSALRGRTSLPEGPRLAAAFSVGATVLQILTWTAALFLGVFATILHWFVLIAGVTTLVLLVFIPGRLASKVRGDVPLGWARLSAFGALLFGACFGNVKDGVGIPSDAFAYHIPIARWFAAGSSWNWQPDHLWVSQLPLASSLWSSFTTGLHVPVSDSLFAWSAQTIGMQVWTAALLYDVVTHKAATARGYKLLAGLLAVGIALGHYPAFLFAGFVDWTLGSLLIAYLGLLLCLPANVLGLVLAIVAGGVVAEFRPQGLLFALSLFVPWALLRVRALRAEVWPSWTKILIVVAAIVVSARWWILVWWRWGTPFVPLFAGSLKLDPEIVNAELLYRGAWPAATPVEALRSVLVVTGGEALIAASCWLVITIALVRVWNETGAGTLGAGTVVRLAGSVLPVLVVLFIAQQVPTEWVRFAAPVVPVLLATGCMMAWETEPGATGRAIGVRELVAVAAALAALVSGPGILAVERTSYDAYPSFSSRFYQGVYEQLRELVGSGDVLMLNQNGVPFLPIGYRQLGATYPPWSSLPDRPIRTQDDWLAWLRRNNVAAVVGSGPSGQQWMSVRAPHLIERPDFGSLDEWMASCPGRRRLAHWVHCPVD